MIAYTDWYVIQVNIGGEHNARNIVIKELDRAKVEYKDCLVPLIEYFRKTDGKCEIKVKPMFPGYIFLITDNIDQVDRVLKSVRRLIKILKGKDMFLPLYGPEVEFMMNFKESHYNMTMSYGVIENKKVIIHKGPMTGKERLIRKIDRHKKTAALDVDFMGRKAKVIVPLEIVAKN